MIEILTGLLFSFFHQLFYMPGFKLAIPALMVYDIFQYMNYMHLCPEILTKGLNMGQGRLGTAGKVRGPKHFFNFHSCASFCLQWVIDGLNQKIIPLYDLSQNQNRLHQLETHFHLN
jgi:hypothetical protein